MEPSEQAIPTEMDFEAEIASLKEKYSGDIPKTKYIESVERLINRSDREADKDLLIGFILDLKTDLEDWNNEENPIVLASEAELRPGYTTLLQTIKEYESDTFSSSGSMITPGEAIWVANKLIGEWSDKFLDGVSITQWLSELREYGSE